MRTKKVVSVSRIEISSAEAALYIAEARINVPGKLDVYQNINGMLHRIYTVDVPVKLNNSDPETLLDYAILNMPEEIYFG